MKPEMPNRACFYAVLVALSVVDAGLTAWAFAIPHRPIEYMVAGTLATAIILLALFLWLVMRQAKRPARQARAAIQSLFSR